MKPIGQVIYRMRERGHLLAASLLATWSWGLASAVAVVFALIDHRSGLAAAARYCSILIAVAYWASEALFLRRRWRREVAASSRTNR